MTEETEVAPMEATEEAVQETPEVEETEGEEGTQTAEGESSENADDDPKRKTRHQRRKEQLERARQEAEAERAKAQELQARLEKYEKDRASSKPPQEKDFNSYDEYQAALSGFYAMQSWDAREVSRAQQEYQTQQQAAERAEQMRQNEVQQSWASQVEDAKSRYADFETVVGNPSVPIPQHVADVIKQLDRGPDVAYHLGTHVQEAAHIASLPPMMAVYELGKLEATLSRPSTKTITSAPDPVRPVKPKASVAKSPDSMSMAEYKAARAQGKI